MAAAETASRAAADAAAYVAAAEKAVAIAKSHALAAADTAWGRALRDTDSASAAANRIRSEAPHSADQVAKAALNVLGLPMSTPFTSEDLRTRYRARVEQMDELNEQADERSTPGTSVAELTRAYCLLEPHCTDADWSLGFVRPSTAASPEAQQYVKWSPHHAKEAATPQNGTSIDTAEPAAQVHRYRVPRTFVAPRTREHTAAANLAHAERVRNARLTGQLVGVDILEAYKQDLIHMQGRVPRKSPQRGSESHSPDHHAVAPSLAPPPIALSVSPVIPESVRTEPRARKGARSRQRQTQGHGATMTTTEVMMEMYQDELLDAESFSFLCGVDQDALPLFDAAPKVPVHEPQQPG